MIGNVYFLNESGCSRESPEDNEGGRFALKDSYPREELTSRIESVSKNLLANFPAVSEVSFYLFSR